MHHPRTPRLAAAAAAGLALAGCGISNPYATHTTTAVTTTSTAASSAASTLANKTPVNERGGQIPSFAAASQKKLAAGAGGATPQTAISQYVNLYVNWTSTTVAKVQHRLASISLAGARAQALQAAASYGSDSTLQSSQVTNSGQALSIAKGTGQAAGWWVVVTRETTSGDGNYSALPPADHIYLAQLEHTNNRWVIRSWNPQS